jgi:hypothetical protein
MENMDGCYVVCLRRHEHENKRIPKYLGATEKVDNISPVLTGKWGKKQKKLMKKFFGSS